MSNIGSKVGFNIPIAVSFSTVVISSAFTYALSRAVNRQDVNSLGVKKAIYVGLATGIFTFFTQALVSDITAKLGGGDETT